LKFVGQSTIYTTPAWSMNLVYAAEAERNSEDVRARFGSGFLAGLRVDFFRMLQAVAGFG
jgi:hypothetical protein